MNFLFFFFFWENVEVIINFTTKKLQINVTANVISDIRLTKMLMILLTLQHETYKDILSITKKKKIKNAFNRLLKSTNYIQYHIKL